jgi:hypothetical protein
VKACELTHARHDAAHCLAPGLFLSLKKGERKRLALDVSYQFGQASLNKIEFSGPEALGVDDLRVLHGLVAMAGPKGHRLPTHPHSEVGKELRRRLEPSGEAEAQDACIVEVKYRALSREVGYRNPGHTRSIKESIQRLSKVSIVEHIGLRRRGYRLLSAYEGGDALASLHVALNPRLADSIFGNTSFTRIDFAEVRSLTTDPARLMHQRLCGWIDPGRRRNVSLETLCNYVWRQEVSIEASKKRRIAIRRALSELSDVGWLIDEYSNGKFSICRPKTKTRN